MELTTTMAFCSHGAFSPANKEDEITWVHKSTWQNQFGAGTSFELNLIWFRFSLEIYNQHRKPVEVSTSG